MGVEDQTEQKIIPTVAQEKEWLSNIDPHYANKFYIGTGSDGMVRITFADQKDPAMPIRMQAEVVLSAPGFMTLANLINQVIGAQMKHQQTTTNAVEPPAQEREKLN